MKKALGLALAFTRIGIAAVAALTVAPALLAAQGLVMGPVFKNYKTIPDLFYKGLRHLFGYKIVFNKASAPISDRKPTWFVANHSSIQDFIVLGSTLDGTFAGKGDFLKNPVLAWLFRMVKYIGFRRSSEFNSQSHAKLINNINEGNNTIMFPEATATLGDKLYMMRAALFKILFGVKGVDKTNKEVTLKKDPHVQPIAIKLLEVEGKNAVGNAGLREMYCQFNQKSGLKAAWQWLQIRSMKIELTAFPPIDPKDFANERDMINKAALDIVSVINPGQTTFEKAQIPGQPANKPKPPIAA